MDHRRRLKPFVIPMLYGIAVLAFLLSIYFIKQALSTPVFDEEDDTVYVTQTIFDTEIPVVSSEQTIMRPYNDSEVKVVKYFYDASDEASKQQESIIYYENTYMQNSGVDYSATGKEKFEVLAVLDGTVINVNEDNLLGKIVEIRHNNDLISSYQSLSEISVKKGDTITQGQVIGKSGTCSVASSLKDHLHLEILYNGKLINPESIYDKMVKDL